MAYIITSPCIGVMDGACAAVCPVDGIHPASAVEAIAEGGQYMFIDPDECIDCGACEPECPVQAIYPEQSVPEHERDWIQVNRELAAKQRISTPSALDRQAGPVTASSGFAQSSMPVQTPF